MSAGYFAEVVVYGGHGLQAAESSAIEVASEDSLRLITGESAVSGTAGDIRNLDPLSAK